MELVSAKAEHIFQDNGATRESAVVSLRKPGQPSSFAHF